MQLYEERQQIVEYGKKMIDAQLTTGTGGNISIYNRKEQLIAIKPSGIEYHDITP
ncbi:MAG: class II aldolase/adducin family protein, partial [Fusobacteria bacterium]|nr:class II aldolase/adducin family protein [Fusobacteriota bacterium]